MRRLWCSVRRSWRCGAWSLWNPGRTDGGGPGPLLTAHIRWSTACCSDGRRAVWKNRRLSLRWFEPNTCHHLRKRPASCGNAARRVVSFLSRHISGCVTVGRCVAVSTDIWRTASGQSERCAKPLALPIRAVLSRSRAPDCRAARLAGSSPCCSRQAAGWPCSYSRPGGRAAGSARAISSRLHGGDRVCVAARGWKTSTAPWRAALCPELDAAVSCTKGGPRRRHGG